MEKDEILSAVTAIIREVSVPDVSDTIDANTDLIESGVLDSFAKVELIDALWETFRLELSPAELFTGCVTVERIAGVIKNKIQA